MSRANCTPVEGTDFVKIAQHLGLEIVVRHGFTKCYRPGSRHVGVGISNSRMITLVELVGFTHPLAVKHPKPPAKTVEQMVDFSKDRATILQDFYRICAEGLLNASMVSSTPASPPPPGKSKADLIEEFMVAFNDEPEALVGCA